LKLASPNLPDRIRKDYVNSDRLIGLCDHVFWQDSFGACPADSGFRGGQSIFCKIDRVWECFGRLVRTRRRVVLITGQGDFPVDDRRLAEAPANIFAWFGSNAVVEDPRVHPLPLGLGSKHSAVTLCAEELADGLESHRPRERWLYVNFRPDTNPQVRQPVYDRFQSLSGEDWVTFQAPATHGDNSGYLEALLTHRFVLAPPGNGIDTHRMWEALYAGAIPIVLRSPAMRAFTGLPILFVDDFSEITFDRLREEELRIRSAEWHLDAMFLPYWREKVLAACREVQRRPALSLLEWLPSFHQAFVRRFFNRQ
jgi:hypothetical protein